MMLYSKGDILKLGNERVALVLDNGMRGKDFVGIYQNTLIQRFNDSLSTIGECMVCHWWSHRLILGAEEEVYYNVLSGDLKGWVEEHRLFDENEECYYAVVQ